MSHRTTKAELQEELVQLRVELERVDNENAALRQDLEKEAAETQELWDRMNRVNDSASATIRLYEISLKRAYKRFAFVWLVLGCSGGIIATTLASYL